MMLKEYAKAKNNCCLVYLGPLQEVVEDLISVRPELERLMPGVTIYLCLRDEFVEKLSQSLLIPISQIKNQKQHFAYLEEVTFDGKDLPSSKLLNVLVHHS
jgi:hypothetical protein